MYDAICLKEFRCDVAGKRIKLIYKFMKIESLYAAVR
jgi:hypothetical protein